MKAAVVVFKGTNCDRETFEALKKLGWDTEFVFEDEKIKGYDIVVLPGGFSYGDYLRPGAIARFSPVMHSVERYVERREGVVMGICNGFQILTEAGLLPGAFMKNKNGRFVCKSVSLEACEIFPRHRYSLYVAHSDGNYVVDEKTLKELEDENRILFRYKENPNGSVGSVAGIVSEDFRVFGMMPHPERSTMPYHESCEGLEIFETIGRFCS